MARICPNCGAAAADSASFCTACGTRLPAVFSEAESPTPPQEAAPIAPAPAPEAAPMPADMPAPTAAPAPEAAPTPETAPAPAPAPEAAAPAPVTTPVPAPAPEAAAPAPVTTPVPAPAPDPAPAKKKKSAVGRVIALLLALLVVAGGVLFYLYHEGIIGAYTLDVNQYVRMEPYGYNGYAEVTPSFRRSEFLNDAAALLKGRADLRQNQAKELASLVESYLDTEKRKGLSNGDTVTLTWPEEFRSQKNALLKQYHLHLELDDLSFTVSGLEDPKAIDIFDGLGFEMNGNDGYAYFWSHMDFVNDYSWSFDYAFDKEDHLSNGDVIHVTAEFEGYGDYTLENLINDTGLYPESLEMSYTVEGLPEIVDVDPFDFVSYTVDGTSGSATVRFAYDDSQEPEDFPYIYLNTNTFRDVSKGDTLTVSFYHSDSHTEEYLAEYYGVRITAWEKDYTIDSMDEYLSDFSMLSEEKLTEIRSLADTAMDELELTPLKDGGAEIVSSEHLGEYIILPVGDGPVQDCGLMVLYRNVVRLDNEDFGYITYIFFNKPMIKADGQFEFQDDLTLSNANYTIQATDGDHVLHGVQDMDTFKNAYIEGNKEDFRFISNFS